MKLQAGEIVEVIKEVRGWSDEGLGEMIELVVPGCGEMGEVKVWVMGMVKGSEMGK